MAASNSSSESEDNGRATDPGGLFDGFEGYRTPSTADYQRVFANGIVAVDANVLLNLYRYAEQARNDLLSVMEQLGDRLWIPHQVLVEFWRNRESVLRDPRDTDKTAREMTEARDRAVATFRAWANRVSLPASRAADLAGALTLGFDAVLEGVDRYSDAAAAEYARDTEMDSVLQRLEVILNGRVGPPLNEHDHGSAIEEALRRIEHREPPGYMDKKKEDHGAAGDYLVWEQLLREAEKRCCDVIFVTGDVKEDWWRREAGEQRGPRLELVAEMRRRANNRLLMLRPPVLLSLARELLSVSVQDESVENVDRVDRLLSHDELGPPDGGWTVESVDALLEQLADEAPVQEAVLRHAAANGGRVERDEVYKIGQYAADRSLRGFTRPINRIAQCFREEGRIHELAADVLDASYSSLSENPSAATGFVINSRVLPMFERPESGSL